MEVNIATNNTVLRYDVTQVPAVDIAVSRANRSDDVSVTISSSRNPDHWLVWLGIIEDGRTKRVVWDSEVDGRAKLDASGVHIPREARQACPECSIVVQAAYVMSRVPYVQMFEYQEVLAQ